MKRLFALSSIISSLMAPPLPLNAAEIMRLSRNECVALALENNRLKKISEYDVQIAQAILAQAQSAYWPTLSAGLGAGIMDEPLVFTYPAAQGTLTIPPGVLGPSAVPMQLDLPSQQIEIMDRKVAMASISLNYPLYTGGIRKAVNDQATANIKMARQGLVRTELSVIFDIERAYYGAVLARNLEKVAADTLQRMEATLSLTEQLYKKGSGLVKKTDYLRNKSTVEMIRAASFKIKAKRFQADTALVNLTGLSRQTTIEPADVALPATPLSPPPDVLMLKALDSNPDIATVRAAILLATARVAEARGGYKPKIGLAAKYIHIENSLDTGIMDPQNKDMGMLGIVAQLPLFEGFRTQNNVLEAELTLAKLRMQEEALTDGIALQVDQAYSNLESAISREKANRTGLDAATENRKLNIRAYQEELVETADVIQAQIMEALLEATHLQTQYECLETRATVNVLVGQEISARPPADARQR